MEGRAFGTRAARRFVQSFSHEATLLGYPVLWGFLANLQQVSNVFTLNFGVLTGQDGGTQHAGGFPGVYGHLEGETY